MAPRGAGGSKQHQNNAISFQGECSEANPWRVTLHLIKWTNRSDVIRSLLTDNIIDCCLHSCTISFIAEPFNQYLAQPDTLNYIHWIIFESYTCMLFCKPMSQTYYFRFSRKLRHKPCFDFFGCSFWFSLMKMFAFVFSVALFNFFFISFKNEARFLHTIYNCFSTNRHYPSHCYPPKGDLVELTLMAGFMRLHCPLNIYDRWQWYTEPY